MIIHVMGLPGAGKSTLTAQLSTWLGWPVLSIGAFREGRSPDFDGEAEAWRAFYETLAEHGWTDMIVETSGLNGRVRRLADELPEDELVRVKLLCDRKLLHERVRRRDRDREPEPWAYADAIPDRHVFIDRFYEALTDLAAEIWVDTARCGPDDVLERVQVELAGRIGDP